MSQDNSHGERDASSGVKFANARTLAQYANALSELTARQREIVRLSAKEGLTCHEIADELGLRTRVVRRILSGAICYLDYRIREDA